MQAPIAALEPLGAARAFTESGSARPLLSSHRMLPTRISYTPSAEALGTAATLRSTSTPAEAFAYLFGEGGRRAYGELLQQNLALAQRLAGSSAAPPFIITSFGTDAQGKPVLLNARGEPLSAQERGQLEALNKERAKQPGEIAELQRALAATRAPVQALVPEVVPPEAVGTLPAGFDAKNSYIITTTKVENGVIKTLDANGNPLKPEQRAMLNEINRVREAEEARPAAPAPAPVSGGKFVVGPAER